MARPYYIASFSGGKDSTAMVLHMMDLNYTIDEVLNVDTGLEFPEMYAHIEKVRSIVEDAGIKFTVLRAEHDFEYYLTEIPIKSKKYGDHNGKGWSTPVIRWCTQFLKTKPLNDYLKKHDKSTIQYIGLAADEINRLSRPTNLNPSHKHPLVEWGWSEEDALRYCYERGFDWGGLYKKARRVSCWCCPLSAISSLKMVYTDYPELWKQLEEWDKKVLETQMKGVLFKDPYTVADLAKRFARETKAEREQTKLSEWGIV